jgi:hypothetical protein
MYAMNVRADQLSVFKAVIVVIIVVLGSEVFKEKFKSFTGKAFRRRIA